MHYRTRLLLRRIFLAAFVLLAVAMAVLMHLPPSLAMIRLSRVHSVIPLDKVIHFSSYLLLSLMLCAWLWVGRVPVVKQMLLVILLLLGYSALEEWTQQFTDRITDIMDWYADVAGFSLGCLIVWSISRWGPSWLRVTEETTATSAS